MVLFIIILIIVAIFIVHNLSTTAEDKKTKNETIERRERFVKTISPNARCVVNNGTHLFFIDDVQQTFGADESGKIYSFEGLNSIAKYDDAITIYHKDSSGGICIGKDVLKSYTLPLDISSIISIYSEMKPILRKKLYQELSKYNIKPTHEYECDGHIWGCDINARKFYTTTAFTQIFDFDDLISVTIDNVENNIYTNAARIINISVWADYSDEPVEMEIFFKTLGATYNNMLAMFKGIRNRQYR